MSEAKILILSHNNSPVSLCFNFSDSVNIILEDLKNLVKVKNVTVTLNGVSMPGATGDGTGFPQNFGTWWRS